MMLFALNERNNWSVPALRFRAINRPNILAEVHGEHSPSALVLVTGPRGTGKTVAVSQWAATVNSKTNLRWISLAGFQHDLEHNDRIWSILNCAITSNFNGSTAIQARGFTDLLHTVMQLDKPTVIVVDNWEVVTSTENDNKLIDLLETQPRLTLIVIARYSVSLSGPAIAGRIDTKVISPIELSFSQGDISLLAQQLEVSSDQTIHQLRVGARGWPIATHGVLAEIGRTSGELSSNAGQLALNRFTQDYLRTHLQELNVTERLVLLGASLCGPLPTSEFEYIFSERHDDVSGVLQALQRLGLMYIDQSNGLARIRCHFALKAQLRSLAHAEFGDTEAHKISVSAAKALAKSDLLAGLGRLSNLDDLASMQKIFETEFSSILDLGRPAGDLLAQLPLKSIRNYPLLLGAQLVLGYSDPRTAQASIDVWHTVLRESIRSHLLEDAGPPRVLLLALLCAAERMAGNGEEAHRIARELEGLLGSTGGRRSQTVGGDSALVLATIALSGLTHGDLDMARRNFLTSKVLAEKSQRASEQLRALKGLALTAAVDGDMRLCESLLDEADILSARSGASASELSWTQGEVARAYLALERFDGSALARILDRVEPWLNRMELWPLFVIAEAALVRLQQGEQAAYFHAQARIAKAELGFRGTPHLRTMLSGYVLSLQMVTGKLDRTADQLAALPASHPDIAVAIARLAFGVGDYAHCLQLTNEARLHKPSHRLQCELYYMAATAAWRLNDFQQSFALLAEAAAWSSHWRLTSPMASVPHDWLTLMADAARAAGVVDITETVSTLPKPARIVLLEPLSDAEQRTLRAISSGATIPEAAAELYVSQNTVKFHLRSIYRKLRVKGRDEALARAVEFSII